MEGPMACMERKREDSQEWTDSTDCEEQWLTFPKFNSHSRLGICAQSGSTKTTRCTYKTRTLTHPGYRVLVRICAYTITGKLNIVRGCNSVWGGCNVSLSLCLQIRPVLLIYPTDQLQTRNVRLPAAAAWRGSFHWAPRESQEIVGGIMLSQSNPGAVLSRTRSNSHLLLLPLLQTTANTKTAATSATQTEARLCVCGHSLLQ